MTNGSSRPLFVFFPPKSEHAQPAGVAFHWRVWGITERIMTRFLLITSAVGLCLAAPAFAQTTSQDEMNRQRATPPSSSAQQPSAAPSQQQPNQAQSPKSSSGSSSAQAPSSSGPSSAQNPPADKQNQGRAQNQRQPAPSTNAQAPASSNQPSSAANQNTQPSSNQNAQAPADQKQPKRSATDRNRPSQNGQAQNQQTRQDRRQNAQSDRQNAQSDRSQNRQSRRDNAQTRDRNRSSASLNVNINDTQRTRIASVIRSSNVRPINVNFRIATGVVVPRSVVLHPVSSSIVEIVPEYRGYSYFVTNEQIVIVEPRKKTIIAVLPAGGEAARAQAPASSRTSFTQQQREAIHNRATTLRTSETVGLSGPIVVEEEIPATIELQEFPTEIVTEVPTISTYLYFRQGSDIVVVDPGPRRVIEVIR
jgi:hypothetical protein